MRLNSLGILERKENVVPSTGYVYIWVRSTTPKEIIIEFNEVEMWDVYYTHGNYYSFRFLKKL